MSNLSVPAKIKILHVDDEFSNRLLMEELLSDDYEVTSVDCGESMWKALEKKRPDLILLDVLMPEFDGFSLGKELKSHPLFNSIPFIYVTAKVTGGDIETGFDVGASDYIRKPFNQFELNCRIKNVLKGKKKIRNEIQFIENNFNNISIINQRIRIIKHDMRNILFHLNNEINNIEKNNPTINFSNISRNTKLIESELLKLNSIDEKQAVVFNKFSLIELILEIIPLKVASEVNLAIDYDINNCYNIEGDKDLISAVFTNIIENANKAMLKGGTMQVKIKTEFISSKKYHIITFKDTGIGIKKENLSMIFDYNFTTKGEGHGFGLFFSKQIIEKHKGEISVDSEFKHGATFTIKLPSK